MDLTPLIASFSLFALMEFGDKTHIAVITLSMKNKP
ncbi:TMEM165/GDT1 family protein [Candidatus Bathyarchaeota archaeon]|jgi:putative Ca2+/H+ antiporter (TMEM165/GDT1 family)|nr:TMEM165/GDT1 family protein [Candidatus Bathyarchaeota archaeon]